MGMRSETSPRRNLRVVQVTRHPSSPCPEAPPEGPNPNAAEDEECTLFASGRQAKKRVDLYWSRVHTPVMVEISPASRRLKELRRQARLSIRQVAQALG